MIPVMASAIHSGKSSEVHVSEGDAIRDFARVLALVRAGATVVIDSEGGSSSVAVLSPAAERVLASRTFTVSFAPTPSGVPPFERLHRTISGAIALLPEDSTAVMDADFARDVEAAILSHREPLKTAWD